MVDSNNFIIDFIEKVSLGFRLQWNEQNDILQWDRDSCVLHFLFSLFSLPFSFAKTIEERKKLKKKTLNEKVCLAFGSMFIE